MREILFRGKDIAENWHYGVPLVFTEDYICMTAPHTYSKKVEANTVGQYTGLKDKNGKKIFEGDILSDGINVVSVIWNEYSAEFQLLEQDGYSGDFIEFENILIGGYKQLEIIGNIHDNPELLKGGAE